MQNSTDNKSEISETTPLITQTQSNLTRLPTVQDNLLYPIKKFIKEYVKPTSYLTINSIIFGGSIKAWLDPIMKSLIYDINEVLSDIDISLSSAKDVSFDNRSTSIIGAYLALTGMLAGYFIYRYIQQYPDINYKSTYQLNKLTKVVKALGLSGYIYTGDNYVITAACSGGYPHEVSLCPAKSANDPRIPLHIFCCIEPKYSTQTSIGVATNDYTLVFLNPLAFKLASIAAPRLLYDYKKKPNLYIASDIISFAATTAAYFIVRDGITPRHAFYYTVVPLSTFYLTTWLVPLLLTAIPFINKENLHRRYQPHRFWQYPIASLKALATGIGSASLYHALMLTYELQFLPDAQQRIAGRYLISSLLALSAGSQAFHSHSIKDFFKKTLTIMVPEEKFENANHDIVIRRSSLWKKIISAAAVIVTTGILTNLFIQQAIEKQIPLPEKSDPDTEYLATVASTGGMALRFSVAGFGLITYGVKTFWRDYHNNFKPVKKADLNNNLKLNWSSFAEVTTAILMLIGIYKAIDDTINSSNDNTNLFHRIIMGILGVLLIGVFLFGNLIFKKPSQCCVSIDTENNAEAGNINTEQINIVATNSRCNFNNLRGWFNNWCSFLAPTHHRSNRSETQNSKFYKPVERIEYKQQ